MVKKFKRPAKNQLLLLRSAEELGWPDHIPDPLPRSKGPDRSIRLRKAVEGLNRGQINRILVIECDGHGTGFYWHAVEPKK